MGTMAVEGSGRSELAAFTRSEVVTPNNMPIYDVGMTEGLVANEILKFSRVTHKYQQHINALPQFPDTFITQSSRFCLKIWVTFLHEYTHMSLGNL